MTITTIAFTKTNHQNKVKTHLLILLFKCRLFEHIHICNTIEDIGLGKKSAVFSITKTINDSIAFTFQTRFRIDAMKKKKKNCVMSLNKVPNALSHIRKSKKRTKIRFETPELNGMCCDFVGEVLRQIHKVKLKLKHTNKRRDAHTHI